MPFLQELTHPVAGGLVQDGRFPAPTGLRIGRAGFPLPTDDVAHRRWADPKQVRHFVLRVVVVFIGPHEGTAQVIGVGFHVPEAIHIL
jgi:hypothetical protein